jgi:hypothetical protein
LISVFEGRYHSLRSASRAVGLCSGAWPGHGFATLSPHRSEGCSGEAPSWIQGCALSLSIAYDSSPHVCWRLLYRPASVSWA